MDHDIMKSGITKTKTMLDRSYQLSGRLRESLHTTRKLLVLAVALCALVTGSLVHADIQSQINNLNSQNIQAQSSLSQLQQQASSYQNAIALLQNQISAIQTAIAASQAKQVQLTQQIAIDKQQIAQKKLSLADDIKTMYINGSMTTIEELATSKNLSDYIDAEQYRTDVQNDLTTTITTIANLETQVQAHKEQVAQLLQTQQQQQAQATTDQANEQQLLSLNQSQQSQYNQQIAANDSRISQLVAEQAAINGQYAGTVKVAASTGGGACNIGQGSGGYPWCNAPFTFNSSPIDPNGFPERQCTSFAYWYFTSIENRPLQVSGNAGQWWLTANQPVDQTPEVGAIGVEPENEPPHYSPYGHVMIVLALPGTTYQGSLPYTSQADGIQVPPGDVLVMSMNENEEGDFMIQTWPADTLYYIH